MVLGHKPNQRIINIRRMRRAQEVLPVLDRHQLGVGRIDKHLDLLLRVRHRINGIPGALFPSHPNVSVHHSTPLSPPPSRKPHLPHQRQRNVNSNKKRTLTCNHMTGHLTSHNRP